MMIFILLHWIIDSKLCKMNYTESNKKNRNKYKNNIKLKDEVGMSGSKSILIKFVGIITSIIHPYTCYLRGAKTVISYACKSRVPNEQVRCMIIEKSKCRDV